MDDIEMADVIPSQQASLNTAPEVFGVGGITRQTLWNIAWRALREGRSQKIADLPFLPPEIITNIISFLPAEDQWRSCRLVSRAFRDHVEFLGRRSLKRPYRYRRVINPYHARLCPCGISWWIRPYGNHTIRMQLQGFSDDREIATFNVKINNGLNCVQPTFYNATTLACVCVYQLGIKRFLGGTQGLVRNYQSPKDWVGETAAPPMCPRPIQIVFEWKKVLGIAALDADQELYMINYQRFEHKEDGESGKGQRTKLAESRRWEYYQSVIHEKYSGRVLRIAVTMPVGETVHNDDNRTATALGSRCEDPSMMTFVFTYIILKDLGKHYFAGLIQQDLLCSAMERMSLSSRKKPKPLEPPNLSIPRPLKFKTRECVVRDYMIGDTPLDIW